MSKVFISQRKADIGVHDLQGRLASPSPLKALSQSSLIRNAFLRYLSKTKRLCSNANSGFRTIQEPTIKPSAGHGRLPSAMRCE